MKTTTIASHAVLAFSLALAATHTGCVQSPSDEDPMAGTEEGPTGEAEGAVMAYWTSGPTMSTARSRHTATRLRDGRVLIAGGYGGSAALKSTLLCDATGSSCTAAADMALARYDHAAVLLGNGKVLVAGGNQGAGAIKGAEIFDPATGTWSTAAGMNARRTNFTMTLLGNGLSNDVVLVAGGAGGGGSAVSTAEIYDPTAGTWTTTGAMADARKGHAAVRLPDGEVLVVGGAGGSALASAEIYDPSTGTFGSTSWMGVARNELTATLLRNGSVLVAGGGAGGVHASAELYFPDANIFFPAGSMNVARKGHVAVQTPDGKVIVAGGTGSGSTVLASAEAYDPDTGWSALPSMGGARKQLAAVALSDGRVWAIGGDDGTSPVATTTAYVTRDHALAAMFAPRLRFDNEAQGYPMSAQAFYEQAVAVQAPGIVQNTDAGSLSGGQIPTYFQVTRCGDQVRIMYWSFYGYQSACDSFGNGAHHGDWEQVMVTLSENEALPAAVTFWMHGERYTKLLGQFTTESGHPVVYVGKTSHASFEDQGGSGDTCLPMEEWRNNLPGNQHLDSWSRLVSLDFDAEPWMIDDRDGGFVWGASGCGTHPTQSPPACEMSACTWSLEVPTWWYSDCKPGDERTLHCTGGSCYYECKRQCDDDYTQYVDSCTNWNAFPAQSYWREWYSFGWEIPRTDIGLLFPDSDYRD